MKITGNEALFKQPAASQAGKSGKRVRADFSALLEEATKNKNPATGNNQSTQSPGSIRGISLNPLFDTNSASIPNRVEAFLNLLESYRDMLADPAVSLKEIDPVMQELSSEKSNLHKMLGGIPQGDELKGILNQVLVAASLEEIKFNKGDYNPV